MSNIRDYIERMPVRSLMLTLSGLGVALALVMAGIGWWNATSISSVLGHSADLSDVLQNHTAADARMDSLRADVLRLIAVKTKVSSETEEDIQKDFDEEVEILRTSLAVNEAKNLSPEIDTGYAKAKVLLEPFIAASNDELKLVARDPAEGSKKFEQYRLGFSELEEVMDNTRTLVEEAVAKGKADSGAIVHRQLITFGIAVLFGLLLVLGCSTLIRGAISRLLRQIADATSRLASGDRGLDVPGRERSDEIGQIASAMYAFQNQLLQAERETQHQAQLIVESVGTGLEQLAQGNLVHRMTAVLSGPFAKLKDDFNTAMERLQDTLKSVLSSTGQIGTGAGEISAAADDLSHRTEQQAASLEETAAALEEITATVKKTASNAKEARTSVTSAQTAAEEGGRVVNTAIQAMDAISQSSRQITDIIGVIDEIAFQTNLLALNAGVEAARAGDAGRGFAVVASEVRALAGRSSDAAKQIKSLINTSGEQVDSGVRLVGQSGAALRQIMEQVQQINSLVSEMAQAAEQQSTGIEQVNSAVAQMDQVTQQNAAMVEESTAASRNLASETKALQDIVGFFDVGRENVTQISAPRRRSVPQPVAKSDPKPRPGARSAARRGATVTATAPDGDWAEF